jgi:hypothetical protein
MDTLNQYRRIIRSIIEEYAHYKPVNIDAEDEIILDEANDHYELMRMGWDGWKRVHGSVLHIDIRDGKIWIQHDGTEDGIANELLKAGVPHEHIVLAFKHPDVRHHTDFAMA